MHLMHFIQQLLTPAFNSVQHHTQPQPHGQPAHAPQGHPDITYNPNQGTNIPYSAHSPQMANQGNQYVAHPTAPQFIGVDPAQFGFPQDLTFSSPHAVNQGGFNPLDQMPQGGAYNPGQVPLQSGQSYANRFQPAYSDPSQRLRMIHQAFSRLR